MFRISTQRLLALAHNILIIFALFLVSACSAPPGNPVEGKRWYLMHNCSSCHGLHGGDGKTVNIAGTRMSFGKFVRKLRSTNSTIMPTFPESKISKQDAADIYSYLQSKSSKVAD